MYSINKPFSLLAVAISSVLLVSGCNNSSDNDNKDDLLPKATNVILMISDGASDGAWDIASYWRNGDLANNSQPYSQLDSRFAMTTFPMNSDGKAADNCDDENPLKLSYDKDKAWDNATSGNEDRPFEGYEYINEDTTDSAAAGTALATGEKTFGGGISVNYCGQNLTTISEIAKNNGLSTGIVTSVQYNHATPAVFAANNQSRSNYADIGHSMLTGGYADLIMGAGHPKYDRNGKANTSGDNYKYIKQEDWAALQAGTLKPNGSEEAWGLIENKNDFDALANNTASEELLSAPLFGLVQNDSTLQQSRDCTDGKDANIAFDCPTLDNQPTLPTMTTGALNYLSQNKKGFFLMVEGGAVDWAAHGNHTARIIEEQIDFNSSVSAVIEWVENNSNWEETLLIVTTDHGNSYVLGGTSDQNAYAPVENPGKGVMPEVKYYSGNHTNELVRVYAKGKGVQNLEKYINGTDEGYAEKYNHTGATGDYIDNTNIFDVMNTVITEK